MATRTLCLAIAALLASGAYADTIVNVDGQNISAATGDSHYVNGMADPVGGFVTLEAAEAVRAKAKASGVPALVDWANNVLPLKFAHPAACDEPALGLSEADKFSVQANCGYARTRLGLMGAASSTWWPELFNATAPAEKDHVLYVRGANVPHGGAFASDNPVNDWKGPTIAELPALFEAALEAAKASIGEANDIRFGKKVV